MTDIERNLEIAKSIFPEEIWIARSERIFVAKSRFGVNKQDSRKLEKEIAQVAVFERFGHSSVLVPEIGAGKHFDSISDEKTTEFKTVSGSLDKVGKHFAEAIGKAENVFILIKSDFRQKEVYNAFRGRLKGNPKNSGIVYVYLEQADKMLSWSIKEISDSVNLTKAKN